jgi:metal-dependent amidase/aminoacylase/carboxypeptidase family protein
VNNSIQWAHWLEDQTKRLDYQKTIYDIAVDAADMNFTTILNELRGVSYQEVATSAFVSDMLLGLGNKLSSINDVRKYETEVVATRGNSPSAYIRVDLDAVSMGAKGSAHTCGYSTNMASVLTVANRAAIQGLSLGIVFQPAEEGPGNEVDGYVHPRGFGGGQYLREKGVYKNIPLILSCHLDTSLANNQVRITAKQATAAAYRFTIMLQGKSAHAALPWQGINPVEKMNKVLGALFELNKEFKKLTTSSSGEYGLVTPSQVHTTECELNSLSPEAMIKGISRVSGEKSLHMFNLFMAKYDAIIELEAPPVFNAPALAELATEVAKTHLYDVRTDPARFRDETAWAGPLTKPWVNNPESYVGGCDSILLFFTPSYNPESGGLHSDDFKPDFAKAIEAQVNMLFSIVQRLQ